MKLIELFENNTQQPFDNTSLPYIIAEAGVNHECDLELAKRLIREAKEGGADAIKFQSYKAGTIASKNSPGYWDFTKEATRTQYDLFKKFDKFSEKEYIILKDYCDEIGIEFMSTPFDLESADYLNNLMPAYKISSSDITNRPFIEYMAQLGKPIILSTGASYIHEVVEALEWIEPYNTPVALLHCILNYPTLDENANLAMISDLKLRFPKLIIGYSDHTLPNDMKVLETAFLLGAVILEKHFTHDKSLPGNDHYHAMDKEDLKVFRKNISRTHQLLGNFKKAPLESEGISRQNARRSLVASKDIPMGKVIEAGDLTWKRPASGISPKYIHDVIGKTAGRSIQQDDVLTWSDLS